MTNQRLALLPVFALLAVLAGCGDGDDDEDVLLVNDDEPTPVFVQALAAVLSPNQLVVPLDNDAWGRALVRVPADRLSIEVGIDVHNVLDLTGATLNAAGVGVDGPAIFTIFAGSPAQPFDVTLTSANFIPAPGAGINTFDQAITAILAGNTYVNVTAASALAGAARGQLGPVSFTALLDGAEQVPPTASLGTGMGMLELRADQEQLSVTLNVTGLTDIQSAHIHAGVPGSNGPVLFVLSAVPFTSSLVVVLDSDDLVAAADLQITDWLAAIDQIIAGRTYINVHTTTVPGGEIRGQILAE